MRYKPLFAGCRKRFGSVAYPTWFKGLGAAALVFASTWMVFSNPVGKEDFLIDLWTSDNGLPDSSVTAIAQTAEGYLWIGTYNGLVRFDGVRFVHFDPFNTPELKHARVDGLFVDAQGTLWINTHDGSMTAWRNGVFTHEWQGGQVFAVFSRTNQIFFATARGQLVSRNGNSAPSTNWQTNPLVGTTAGIFFHQDRTGMIWYMTRDGALNRVVGTNSEPVARDKYLNGEQVNCLTTDGGGRLWVGTEKRLLLWRGDHFEDQTPTNGEAVVNTVFIACTVSNGCWVVTSDRVRKCVNRRWVAEAESWRDLGKADTGFMGASEDQSGGVWLRHYGQGLFHARPDGTTQRVTSADGLPDDRVNCWFQDREGNVWVGVDHGGLVRLREKRFQVIGAAEGLAIPAVSTVCEDADSNVWIGTFGGGLNRWRDGVLTRFDLPDGAYKGNFFSVYPAGSGRVWVSSGREDLFLLENGSFSQPDGLVHGVKVIFVDQKKQIWLGRQNGLTLLASGIRATNYGPDKGIERKDVRALAEDPKGNLWIGTGDGDLYELADEKFTLHRTPGSLENQAICSLLPEADGTLWVGTFRGGLLRFKDGKFTRYTTADGLPSDIIRQILDDGMGKLWIGSHQGIFYVPKDSFKAFDAGKITALPCISYGLYDGLPTLECSGNYQPSCWRGHDGMLWFATVKGLVSVQPATVTVNRQPPPVLIEDVFVDGKPLAIQPPVESGSATLLIPPGKHQFDFHYTALSYAAPDKVRFRYRLAGLDNDWVEAGDKRSAHYGPLHPGNYRFEVTACNNDGIWNETGTALTVRVQPYFWQTWWFDLLTGMMAIAAIIGAVRFAVTRHLRRKLEQLKQQRAIERERERIARDIHDDLGAGLTQILLQSALARREWPEQIQPHLAQISGTARELVGAMDEIVWAINPENDTLDGLVTYAEKFVQEYVTQAGLRCRLDLPAQLPTLVLSAEMRHNLFLAVKETLNNAVKHAHAAEICFQLKTKPGGFSLIIKDDGCGFAAGTVALPVGDSGRISSGHGLRNLVHRLEKIGGQCVIRSTPGKGTEVELTAMLQRDIH